MDNRHVIASAISDNELAQAFSELVAERWDNWDLSPFLAYMVDSVASSALPYLADQFDVAGLQGFAMASTEQQQRDIIKRSIALHKYLGTPWAIREACRTVGYPVVVLEEGVPSLPEPSADDWARFRVLVEGKEEKHITANEARRLRRFVEYYKNERSHLVELGFWQVFADRLFRDETAPHDELDVMYLSLAPNPAIITPHGTATTVKVLSNVPWVIAQSEYMWNDGSDNRLALSFTGEAGKSEIVITSDPYVATPTTRGKSYSSAYSMAYHLPEGIYDREITVDVHSIDGRLLGKLRIRQRAGRNNANSPAYSNAYNLFDHAPYINIDLSDISMSESGDDTVEVHIVSNAAWKIE